jgi:hypothetical protein
MRRIISSRISFCLLFLSIHLPDNSHFCLPLSSQNRNNVPPFFLQTMSLLPLHTVKHTNCIVLDKFSFQETKSQINIKNNIKTWWFLGPLPSNIPVKGNHYYNLMPVINFACWHSPKC